MIVIDKLILHVLDPSSDTLICSDACMDEQMESCMKLIESKTSKIFHNASRKSGTFPQGNKIANAFQSYRSKTINFEQMSKDMATHIFDAKKTCGLFEASDLLLAELVYEERRYIVGIDNGYTQGFTHTLSQHGEDTQNEIELMQTLLSTNFTKKDRAFMIECSDESVSSVESLVEIEAQKRYFYGDVVLGCEHVPSYKDAITSIQKSCKQVIQEYDLDTMEVMPKVKQMIKESVEAKEDIQVDEIAQVVFEHHPVAKSRFTQDVKDAGIKKAIPVEHMKTSKAQSVQKIRTDKGIEISIPVDYMNSTDYVEIHTNADGVIDIQLKNINHITSK